MQIWGLVRLFLVALCCFVAMASWATARDRYLARTTDSGKECWFFTAAQKPERQISGPYKTKKEAYEELCKQVKQGENCDSMQYANPSSLCREYGVELN